jgi:hypothetical protein
MQGMKYKNTPLGVGGGATHGVPYEAAASNKIYRVGHKSLDTSNLPKCIFVKLVMAHPIKPDNVK